MIVHHTRNFPSHSIARWRSDEETFWLRLSSVPWDSALAMWRSARLPAPGCVADNRL
jgi:hypothetical protein